MARILVIEYNDDEDAERMMESIHRASKRGASYRVVALFVKPRRFCKCAGRRLTNYQADKSGHAGVVFGSKFGWWICTNCRRPREGGHQLINQLDQDSLYPDTGADPVDMITTSLDVYSQDRQLVKRRKVKLKKTKKLKGAPKRYCPKCGSSRLRLEVPPDFEAFEVCKDCGHLLKGTP